MYEHLRNDFIMKLSKEYGRSDINKITAMLDSIAADYDINEKSTELAVVNDLIPHEVELFIAARTVEGRAPGSVRNYASHLKNFFGLIQKPLKDITANDIRLYLAYCKKQKNISDSTLEKHRQTISIFLSWACNESYITTNPCKTISPIKCEQKERKALSRFQFERLRRLCKDKRELAIVDVLFSTACRVSELMRMNKSDIDLETKSIHIIGKGRKHNTVYLNDNAILSLQAYFDERQDDTDYMFATQQKPYRRLSVRSVQNILKKYEEALGIEKLTPHILRHTTATICVRAGMPITQIQKMLGHSSVATTQIYAKTNQEDIRLSHEKYVV